jgi:pimeloyl-ACP methyl ester carboxylesterase
MPDVVELAGRRQATFEVVGDGEPLLFFEGGPGLPASLSRLDGELLAERFATYLIDPHGSGGSTPPADPALYDHLGHARFYDEVRTALGIEKATVAGISFGGTVALTYAALFPQAVVRCIAISAFGVGVDIDDGEVTAEQERMLSRHAGAPWYRDARAVMDGWTDRALATEDASEVAWMLGEVLPFYCAFPDRPDVRRRIEEQKQDQRIDLAAIKAWEGGLYQTIDLRPLLVQIDRPTLVLAGEMDFIGGPAQARQIAAKVRDATLELLPDCGHIPSWEAPDRFRQVILDWSANH